MEPATRIHQAFLQLRFSIKLYRYFEKGLVRKELFDREDVIPIGTDELHLEADTFQTYNDLVLASKNAYSTNLGVCAIAMETALIKSGCSNNPADETPRGQLRSFVYQVRNAFAHDSMTPVWSAKGPYARTYDLRPFGIAEPVDLAALDTQGLELEQFGGMRGFEALRDAVLGIVRSEEAKMSGTIV